MAIPSVSNLSHPLPVAPYVPADTLAQDAAVTVTAAADSQKSAAFGESGSGNAKNPFQEEAQQFQALPAQSVETALDDLNKNLEAWSTKLRFEMDPDAQRLVVTVLDSETGDTIRTIPSDAVIRVAKMIVNLQGQLVKTQA